MKPYFHHIFVCLFIICATLSLCLAAERESDGAYSPNEKKHHVEHHHPYHPENDDAEAHHRAIIGNEELHEKMHSESSPESRSRLLQMAAEHDIDKDLQISLEELQQWIFQSFRDLSQEDAVTRFREADKDLDGFVTWSEHLKETWGLSEDDSAFKTDEYKDELPIIKEEEVIFAAADRNEDGALSEEEFVVFERPEQYDFMHPLVIQRTKEAKDKNGDGYIDFHEYIVDIIPNYKSVLSGEDKETFTAEKERFEQHFDLDRDGRLNDSEIFRWMIPDDNATASAEAQHIMDKADLDRDGYLSFDEMERNYDVFVGSEITDYGNALSSEEGRDNEEDKHDEL